MNTEIGSRSIDAEDNAAELSALRFGYPDLSEGDLATQTLALLSDDEREALELFMVRFRLPADVMRFIKGLVGGYCQKDPRRTSSEAKAIVLEHLRYADIYLNMVGRLDAVPVLGEDRAWEDYPKTGWDVYAVSKFMKQVCDDSRGVITKLAQQVQTPEE